MAPKRGGEAGTSRRTVERVMEVTGAHEEDVRAVLAECEQDVNRATHLLIDRT